MTDRSAQCAMLNGWDWADWMMVNPLLEKGRTPNLQLLIECGVMGNGALEHDPNNSFPHYLAQFYSRAQRDHAKATEHRKPAEAL